MQADSIELTAFLTYGYCVSNAPKVKAPYILRSMDAKEIFVQGS
jgi:hypothetical protein